MATHSSIVSWRIPGTEEPGGLQSVGLQRVRLNWSDSMHWIHHNIASVLCFVFSGLEACGILAPPPGIEPISPALVGEVLTTGPPGKSQVWSLAFGNLLLLLMYQYCFPTSLMLLAEETSHCLLLPGILSPPCAACPADIEHHWRTSACPLLRVTWFLIPDLHIEDE